VSESSQKPSKKSVMNVSAISKAAIPLMECLMPANGILETDLLTTHYMSVTLDKWKTCIPVESGISMPPDLKEASTSLLFSA